MSQEVSLGGTIYISSKRAAEITGYAQDYIGQLARSGQIEARRISGMWYILEESLQRHKEGARAPADEIFVPAEKAEIVDISDTTESRDDVAEETEKDVSTPEVFEHTTDGTIISGGKEYLSAVRASKITGYSHDYVTQLARAGKIPSRQIGNRWYVEHESIANHKKEKDALLAAVQAGSVGLDHVNDEQSISMSINNAPPHFTYGEDRAELLPQLGEKTLGDDVTESSRHEYVVRDESELESDNVNQIPIRVVPQTARVEPAMVLHRSMSAYLSTPKMVVSSIVFVGVVGSLFGAFTYFDRSPGSAPILAQHSGVTRSPAFAMSSDVRSLAEGMFAKELIYQRGH